jgi:hypothetical protein
VYINHGKAKVLTQENHDKPFCEAYRCPSCHKILPKEEDFEDKAK